MRALLQRVSSARVDVDAGAGPRGTPEPETVGRIGCGLCILVGVTHDDGPRESRLLADKLWQLRVFADEAGVMNRSLADLAGAGQPAEALVVSQFTLYADTSRGRRPSWAAAAPAEQAAPLVEAVAERLATLGATVATGRFGADMHVSLVNDGPVTLLVEVLPAR
ncbi:MAG: D-tyrosyl-tRNA(Tyr) deacylase [Actinobacteria bacterium]|nr:D-tyrosyl-tRNA(Tyr) deacylase [Actinomycetota bacterium]